MTRFFKSLFGVFDSTPVRAAPEVADLTKVRAKTAAEVCQRYTVPEEAAAVLTPQQSPGEYLAALEEAQLHDPAVDFLAAALPPRESAWWAAESAEMARQKLTDPDAAALDMAKLWVQDPTAENAAAAGTAAADAGHAGPGAWSAQAADWAQQARQGPPPPDELPPGTTELARDAAAAAGLSDEAVSAVAQGAAPALTSAEAARAAEQAMQTAATTRDAGTPDAGPSSETSPADSTVDAGLAAASMFTSAATGSMYPLAVGGAVKMAAALLADAAPLPATTAPPPGGAGVSRSAAEAGGEAISAAAPPDNAPPPDPGAIAQALQPFIDLGKKIAGDQQTM